MNQQLQHPRARLLRGMAGSIAALLMACDMDPSNDDLPEPLPAGTLYTSTASVWETGPLAVQSTDLPSQKHGVIRPVRIHAPKSPGTYAVVQFQHGFMGDVHTYDQMLQHIASHGFVVVAPQMYPADGIPLGKPPAAEEAAAAVKMTQWTRQVAPRAMAVASDGRPPALIGHSRGGKVAWLAAKAGAETPGIIGVDPVDGRGGPLLSAQPEALPGPVTGLPRSLVIGMSLGGACAPQGDNYQHFFDRTTPPTTLFVVVGHGHGDMLDDTVNLGGLCAEGPRRVEARRTVAGLVTAQLRAWQQNDTAMADMLSDVAATNAGAPEELTREVR